MGGDDLITVIPHLDGAAALADPKPVLGYSDNTNLHQWLWSLGIASFYGGSTQVHLGPGPHVDPIHVASLRAALLTGAELEITEPGESEDMGHDWLDPRALTEGRYNPGAVVCVGVPFGHTRPQWILPHGGTMMVDGAARRITASYA